MIIAWLRYDDEADVLCISLPSPCAGTNRKVRRVNIFRRLGLVARGRHRSRPGRCGSCEDRPCGEPTSSQGRRTVPGGRRAEPSERGNGRPGLRGTETTDKAPAAPSPLTALPVDESGGRAAMLRWYAERQSAINRAPSLRPAALHNPLPRLAAHSPWRPRRRPVAAAEFSDLLRTLAPPSVPDFGCPKSLGAACASSR